MSSSNTCFINKTQKKTQWIVYEKESVNWYLTKIIDKITLWRDIVVIIVIKVIADDDKIMFGAYNNMYLLTASVSHVFVAHCTAHHPQNENMWIACSVFSVHSVFAKWNVNCLAETKRKYERAIYPQKWCTEQKRKEKRKI